MAVVVLNLSTGIRCSLYVWNSVFKFLNTYSVLTGFFSDWRETVESHMIFSSHCTAAGSLWFMRTSDEDSLLEDIQTLHKQQSKCLNKRRIWHQYDQMLCRWCGLLPVLYCLSTNVVFFSTRLRWVSSSATLVCDERSGASALLVCSVFKRQPWQLHKGWELKQGSRCYFPGTERLSRIDQQWVCHKSVNLSPIRSL